jgi:hypothetical protein
VSASAPTAAADPRAARCAPSLARYAVLLVELALVLAALWTWRLRDLVGPAFFEAAALSCAGFAVHYWLPLRFKEWAFVALSIGGAFAILDPRVAALLLAAGAAFFAIGRSPLPYAARVAAIVALGAALTAGRALGVPRVPGQLWPLLGSVFVFRLIVWTYDLRHLEAPPRLRDFLAYFFLLPNWGCLLFPVVDFQTQRRSFLARDVHEVAQQGVRFMARGLVQLLLYDWIYYNKPIADPAAIDSLPKLLGFMVSTWLLYLRVSGSFHFVVGLLHLFGYDLPETNRRWLLASSLTDFWRRINVYWKDFMVKVVYFPAYFRLRRGGELKAQAIATALVFAVTWLLHAWQNFWLEGAFLLRATDAAFWAVLGVLMVANQVLEARARPPAAAAAPRPPLARALGIAGTFLLLSTLWSLWNAKSFSQWFDLLTWWKVGD